MRNKILLVSLLLLSHAAQSGVIAHQLARQGGPAGYPERYVVKNNQVDWDEAYKDYAPPFFVATPYAGHYSTQVSNDWFLNEKIFASAFHTVIPDVKIEADPRGRPLNPVGRTGLRGPGGLQRWGEVVQAELVVTRVEPGSGHRQVLLLRDPDANTFALPGKRVGHELRAQQVLENEFLAKLIALHPAVEMKIEELYAGYVDDPRNTDNSWLASVMYNLDTTPAGKEAAESGIDWAAAINALGLPGSAQWVDFDQLAHAAMNSNHAAILGAVLSTKRHHDLTLPGSPEKLGILGRFLSSIKP